MTKWKKGADAVCSLRLHYHIRKWKSENPPTTSISILDSCVGQNKSQTVMQFFSFLSDCFYDKVVLLFLKSGHSHMFPDRATAHANNAVKNEIYVTQTMLFRLSTQYKGSTQSFWIITRQNHHFSLAGMHWWRNTSSPCQAASQIISSLSLIKVCALCSSEQTHLIVKLGVLLCSLPWRNVKSAWRSVRYRADISEIIFDEV